MDLQARERDLTREATLSAVAVGLDILELVVLFRKVWMEDDAVDGSEDDVVMLDGTDDIGNADDADDGDDVDEVDDVVG